MLINMKIFNSGILKFSLLMIFYNLMPPVSDWAFFFFVEVEKSTSFDRNFVNGN